jgi:WD40 repeat protein
MEYGLWKTLTRNKSFKKSRSWSMLLPHPFNYTSMPKRSIFIILLLITQGLLEQTAAQSPKTKETLWTADWSPDGKHMAIGGNADSLKIYNAESLNLHKSFPVKNTLTRIKWHPSRSHIMAIVTQMSEEKPFIIDVESEEKIVLHGISSDGARGADWNHTGQYLAIADNDGQISMYDQTGRLIRQFGNGNTKSITSVAWHPKKDILVTVGDRIRMFDIHGNLLLSFPHREAETLLLCVAWHPSGDFFVTGDYGDSQQGLKPWLQYWKENGELLISIESSKGEYRNLSWNPAGTRLATASDALRIWDTHGNLISEGNSVDFLWGVSWNKKGNRIITSGMAQSILLWNKNAKRIKTIE